MSFRCSRVGKCLVEEECLLGLRGWLPFFLIFDWKTNNSYPNSCESLNMDLKVHFNGE